MTVTMPQITITSVFVNDQERALRFYVDVLGFLPKHGVRFTQSPTDLGPVVTAVLDDTCGNLIQLSQET